MIASWMLYAAVVGALMTVAATALDRAATARRRPTRMIWFVALLLSIAWPVGRAAARIAPTPTRAVRLMPFTITVQSPPITSRASLLNREAIDRALLFLWGGLSVLLLLRLTRGVLTLRRTSSTWKPAQIDGTHVRLSSNVGPAVIGLRSMDVVYRSGFCRSTSRSARSCCVTRRSIGARAIHISCSAPRSPSR
jgi:hypothetical protein